MEDLSAPGSAPHGALADGSGGNSQRLGILMEKYTQQADEDEHHAGEGRRRHRATQSQRTERTSQPSDVPRSLEEASSQLSRWLDGYFTDPLCGLKGVVIVTLFEALDVICGDDEPWDGVGNVSDMYVVRGLISGGMMEELGWEVGAEWVKEGEEDLSSLDEELQVAYPAVYGLRVPRSAVDDDVESGTGFPSVSFGPGGETVMGREEETCEQGLVGVGGEHPGRDPASLPVVMKGNFTGQDMCPDEERDDEIEEQIEEQIEEKADDDGCHVDVAPTPVGEATEAAVGELLRLGDVFAAGGNGDDRDLREAADDIARRLRRVDHADDGHDEKDTGMEQEGNDEEEGSEIVPNSQEEEEMILLPEPLDGQGDPAACQRSLRQDVHRESQQLDDDGFAVPQDKTPREQHHSQKGATMSSDKGFNVESDPYLLSGLHATADCLAMVQPTAREDHATEPWMSIPRLNVGDRNQVVCDAKDTGKPGKQKQRRVAQGGRNVPVAKKARTTTTRAKRRRQTETAEQQEELELDELDDFIIDIEEDLTSGDGDAPSQDETSDEGKAEEADDGEVQVRNRPHRMIATCPSESQASVEASRGLKTRIHGRENDTRKSKRLAAHQHVGAGDQKAHGGRGQRPRRRSTNQIDIDDENTEDVPIAEYVKGQKKVGCSKCRYRGCKACRGYTLKELAKKKGVLSDIAFMISRDGSKVGTKAQAELSKTIKDMGGHVLNSLSDLVRTSVGVASVDSPKSKTRQVETVLVTSSASSRTLKCIAARIIGIPMISPGWIADCKEKNRLGSFGSRNVNVLVSKGDSKPLGPLLDQRRVYLVVERPGPNVQDINALIKLLGGILVRGSFDSRTDLVLYDGSTSSSQLKKEIDRVKREARKLRKPVYSLSWLTDAIANGETDDIVEELEHALDPHHVNTSPVAKNLDKGSEGKGGKGRDKSRAVRRKERNPGRPIVPETEGDGLSEDDLMAIIQQQQADSEHRREKEQRMQEDQRNQQRARRGNRQSRHLPAGHRAGQEAETDDPFCQPILHPFQGVSSMNHIECTWIPPEESPSGTTPPEGMRPSPIRKYFVSLLSSSHETMRVGDFVELVPGPGASQPRIAQVLALWKQVGMPRDNCLYGRFLRYYRFEETSLNRLGLKSVDHQNRVYKTSHIEENVPLAAVLNTCRVEVMSGVDAPTEFQTQQMSDKDALLCCATYDFETGALAPIE